MSPVSGDVADVLDGIGKVAKTVGGPLLGANPIAGAIVGAIGGALEIIASLVRGGHDPEAAIERMKSAIPELADARTEWVSRINAIGKK